ncbi:shikimate O-hydroxycinnamoyltransferase-like protein [Tanacetum coccineum]|uniref:Shikimate O-hydroxycinnamoyltransferase-like protein n=1 Tax=Tanacetum coccineum TaxID=301880 RepID=A0ABQ4YJ94_9ASTR
MNMREYYHLLGLRRSKGLFISSRRCVHDQTSPAIKPHHLSCQPRQPPTSSPYSHLTRNTYNRNTILSHHYLQASHFNLTRDYYDSQLSKLHTSQLELPEYEDEITTPLDYQVTIKGTEVVKAPVTLENKHWLPLSNLDLLLPPIEAGVFFCYKKKNNTDMSTETVVNKIKTSMAGVLSTFYPLAGEIVTNSQGEPEMECNNGGVEFVHAHADIKLKDMDFHHPDHSVKGKLIPKINHGVLAVQATEMKCGSIIISCAFNHQIIDGYSLNMFLCAWAKYAQSETILSMPSFRPSILNPRNPLRYESSLDNLYVPISSLPPPSSFEEPLLCRTYYVRAESIERLQAEASTKETKRSKLVSFTAYMWKLLSQGHDDANTSSRMGVVVDGRRFLTGNNEKNASLLENHFGNVLSVPYGVAENSDLKKMPLHEIADGVHRFVAEATNEEHFRGLIDWVQMQRPQPAVATIYFGLKKSEGEALVVSGGQGLPLKDMDFGWGKPEFGSYHVPWGSRTGYITMMPSAARNGDWVVYMHLKQNDFDMIENMAPDVFAPLSISTFL